MLDFIVSPVVAPTAVSFMFLFFIFCFFKYPQMQILYRSIDAFDNLSQRPIKDNVPKLAGTPE